jgi:hypothetical protein
MKGVTGTVVKPFLIVYINSNGQVSSYSFFDTKAEADDFSARTVSANKSGEAVLFTAGSVTKLPTPEVVVQEIKI